MPFTSLFLINDVPIECINRAAITYSIPAELIISVLKTENGRNGMAKPNDNGTFDYGPMQINTVWLSQLRPYGYTKNMLQFDPCMNAFAGSWILAQRIAEAPNIWHGVGSYHSYTRSENLPYQNKVWKTYRLLHRYVDS
jgi:hypothetical protein